MSFATFHDEHGTFFCAKFHSYVLTVYSNDVYYYYFTPCVFFTSILVVGLLLFVVVEVAVIFMRLHVRNDLSH